VSSRIRVNFKDNSATDITWYTKIEERGIPIDKAKEDEKILRGFIWKPKERPASKEVITSPAVRKQAAVVRKAAAKAPPKGTKPGAKRPSAKTPTPKAPADSSSTAPPVVKPPAIDTLKRNAPADTAKKASPADTLKKKPDANY
jgi:hypothetical protein